MTTRLNQAHVLDHPLRAALVDLIRREPGIAFVPLYDRFKAHPEFGPSVGHGSLSFHLLQLERFGFITTRKSGRHRRHYENGGGWNGDTTRLAVLQADGIATLARIVLAEPGLNQQALWQRLLPYRSCSRQSIAYHLRRMEDHGLVVAVRRGPGKNYVPTDKLARLMPFAPAPDAIAAAS